MPIFEKSIIKGLGVFLGLFFFLDFCFFHVFPVLGGFPSFSLFFHWFSLIFPVFLHFPNFLLVFHWFSVFSHYIVFLVFPLVF